MSRPLIVASSFLLSFFADITLSHKTSANILPGYACIILHGLATYALEHLRGVLSPTISPIVTTAASTFGAALLGLPLYAFRRALVSYFVTRIYLHLTSSARFPPIARRPSAIIGCSSYPHS